MKAENAQDGWFLCWEQRKSALLDTSAALLIDMFPNGQTDQDAQIRYNQFERQTLLYVRIK